MKPRSPEALNGLAGLYTKQQQYSAAAGVYEQLIRVQPGLLEGWRGLFIAYARDDQNAKALVVLARFPAKVKAALNKDPDYLRTLAGVYQALNRNADAQRVLAQALALPFPDNGATLLADTKLQYAGILLEAKHYDQAVALYSQVLINDPSNVSGLDGPDQRPSRAGPGRGGHRRRAKDACRLPTKPPRRSRLPLHARRHLSAGQPV